VTVYQKALGNKKGTIELCDDRSGSGTGVYERDSDLNVKKSEVDVSTLDVEIKGLIKNPIILVDVEGYEPFVLEGGKEFIKKNKPLIIFKYNDLSKKHFHIYDIKKIIGNAYDIYHMRSDGYLDNDYIHIWNCVAFHKETVFEEICMNLVKA
jgi:hypothetical protein